MAKLTPEQVLALRSVPLGSMPNKVRLARTMLGLSQGDVARELDFNQPLLSQIERGDYGDVMLERSRAIADLFGCSIEDLFPSREAVA